MNKETLEKMEMIELLELKEFYRTEYGLHIENNMEERGSRNHKTKEYFTCHFTKRVRHPTKKGMRWNAACCYRTFDTYKEALVFCLSWADRVLEGWDKEYGK